MDLSSVVLGFASAYTVTRASGAGAYGSDGKFDEPGTTTLSVQAVVHPLTGRDLQRLPEGLRTSDVLCVYSVERLRVKAAGERPDKITIGGEQYQVEHVEDWSTLGNYFRSYVRKVGR